MRRRGQSTIEIVVLIAIIAVAVLSMNRYVRRTIMGRLKASADQLGPQFSVTQINHLETYSEANVQYTSTQNWGGAEEKEYQKKDMISWSNIELDALDKEEFLK